MSVTYCTSSRTAALATAIFISFLPVSRLFAGLILGLVTLTYSISFAALIYSGSLSPYFPQGLASALIGSVIVGTIVAAASGFPFAIAGLDANGAPILALMASAIAQELQATGNAGRIFPTV